jgi:hypothetical protein
MREGDREENRFNQATAPSATKIRILPVFFSSSFYIHMCHARWKKNKIKEELSPPPVIRSRFGELD